MKKGPVPKSIILNKEWWDYLKCDNPNQIQWTPKEGGWVRARASRITNWYYKKCGRAFEAQSIGEALIERR